jgi:hypothetical protein
MSTKFYPNQPDYITKLNTMDDEFVAAMQRLIANLATDVTGTLAATNGGTGLNSYAAGDIIYASSATAMSKLVKAGTGNVLLSGNTPTWGKVALTTHVSGTLPVANGGTGVTTLTGLAYGNGTSAFTVATSAQIKTALGTLAIADGGTGATTAVAALAALGAFPSAGGTISGDVDMSGTGAIKVPVGTDANRPTGAVGKMRYNTTISSFEGHNGTSWGSIGGGAKGGGANQVFFENDTTITANYTITTGKNAMSAGPITIADGATVTIPNGSIWTSV